ncbi:TPA: restriction endonuclease subunit S [Acinetobacter baumannii]|uniref:restriction endonuclease subunit S n=1 Tax=Acinetobacter baumannii TaxID=470 RepID=UPI000E71D55B|nr:restriction endonuclease subunit S [Acinetobacter baumannii]EKT9841842.1 restriction endonuclease subunit S [Acinetobacter baumannii]EKT9846198.1 restriction endonuclease subunit S [Acinetobacter baumannii]EKV4084434.1 restriction endonuclease subunit S [Acinetobacter baumannii]RJN71071.1 restriction endonuclease subunit S [Acinetobacter baumannii]TPU86503.1 restriction endonuclease subunit S [Acinetobacter baumannii]
MSWPIVTLNDIAINIVDGPFGSSLKTSDYVDEGVPVLQGKNITGNRFKFFDVRHITEKKAESIKRSTVKVGDHLLVKIGSIGYSAIIDDLYGHDFAIIPANLAKITPNKEVIDSRYLHRYLTSDSAIRYFQKIASKTAQPALSLSKIKALEIPLPPLSEQRRIASILDQADELRQKRQQAIEKLDQLLQATFIDMFGDPVSNPKQFICKTLEQISSFENGDRSSNYPSGNDLVFAGIPFLSTKNIRCNVYDETNLNFITEEKFSSLSRGKVKNNEILITLRGTLGATCIFKSKYDTAFINAQMMIIRSDPLIMSNDFLHAILSFESMQEYFRRVGQGAAVPQLTATQLKKLEIIIPSIELQNEFLRINQEIQKLKNEFSNSFSKYDLLFKSLQNQAFNGTL